MDQMHLSAVAYLTEGVWMVQGIEYDIRARALSPDDVPRAITAAVREQIAIDTHLGRQPFEGVKPAPTRFAEMFQKAGDVRAAKVDGEVEVRLLA